MSGFQAEKPGCPFCDYSGPSPVLRDCGHSILIEPIDPVVPGHVLVVPRLHVEDFAENPEVFARCAHWAATLVCGAACNLITSKGRAATQTVRHLHLHLVPRFEGDGVALPWS